LHGENDYDSNEALKLINKRGYRKSGPAFVFTFLSEGLLIY